MEIVAVEIEKAVWYEEMMRGAVEVASGVWRMCHRLLKSLSWMIPQLLYQYTLFIKVQATPMYTIHQSSSIKQGSK